MISSSEREVIRALAGRTRQIADLPEMADRKRRLYALNALRPERPIVLAFAEGGWRELLPENVFQCQDPVLRWWEHGFRREIYWWEHIRDDHVLEPWFNVNWVFQIGDYGVEVPKRRSEDFGSYVWDPPIKDLDKDLAKLHYRPISVDRAETNRRMALAQEVFGDLRPPRLSGSFYWTVGLTWRVIDLIGLERMMFAMCDEPGNLHRLMAWLRDEHMHLIEWFEKEGLYGLNNRNGYVGSGGVAYTDELPRKDWREGQPVCLKDLWGLAESQETVGVSPAMFGEFVFPYQLPLLERFGLTCYGCCEPVHQRWDYIRRIPNLRRVSVSPWCDQELMAGYLDGKYVFSRKPNPAQICVSFNEGAIRADVRRTLDIAGGGPLEIIMKDTHTFQNDPMRVIRWVRIALDEVDRHTG